MGLPLPSSPHGEASSRLASLGYSPSLRTSCFTLNQHSGDIMMRRLISHPALALGSTLLWGAIELLALFRSRWSNTGRAQRG
jgi:hypothetical protein